MNDRLFRYKLGVAARLVAAFLVTMGLAASAPAAPGDARFCRSYAANVAGIGDLATKKNPACLDYSKGVHGNFQMHYDWCMKTSASSVQGAETNIRRLASLCTGNAPPKASGGSRPQPKTVQSSPTGTEEPYGENIGVWRFTQDAGKLCRAYAPAPGGSNIIARRGKDGTHYVSVWGGGFAKGKYPQSSINIAGREEPVDAENGGVRFVLSVDNDQFGRIIKARGFKWRALDHGRLVTGSVTFDGSVGAAYERVRKCVKANGGR